MNENCKWKRMYSNNNCWFVGYVGKSSKWTPANSFSWSERRKETPTSNIDKPNDQNSMICNVYYNFSNPFFFFSNSYYCAVFIQKQIRLKSLKIIQSWIFPICQDTWTQRNCSTENFSISFFWLLLFCGIVAHKRSKWSIEESPHSSKLLHVKTRL